MTTTPTTNEGELDLLLRVKRLFDEALPRFNWGASYLDANAIQLLNTVPLEVKQRILDLRARKEEE